MYYLLDTNDATLVEASPFDPIWGIGLDMNDPNATDRTKWKGSNWLGITLNEVRDYFRQEQGIINEEEDTSSGKKGTSIKKESISIKKEDTSSKKKGTSSKKQDTSSKKRGTNIEGRGQDQDTLTFEQWCGEIDTLSMWVKTAAPDGPSEIMTFERSG